MPPLRRYLRLTAHTVLEIRIYLDNPADANRWLLATTNPALPRIISAIRPLVLPKLREEDERARGKNKGKKKNVAKDVVNGDDFEVSIFLTRSSSRHTILYRDKVFTAQASPLSNDQSRSPGNPGVQVLDEHDDDDDNALRNENAISMNDIPLATGNEETGDDVVEMKQDQSSNAYVRSHDPSGPINLCPSADDADDKKKMAFDTTYDGFSIYRQILCLVVKRKGGKQSNSSGGQAMMEGWIASTQARQEEGIIKDS